MHQLQKASKTAIAALLVLAVALGAGFSTPADAKKKAAKGPTAEEIQKSIDTLTKDVDGLTMKVQSRALLSPQENGKLVEIKFKLMDLMGQSPNNPALVRPLYQAGVLYNARESYNDAYELFNYLTEGYPANPYSNKAKSQMQMLEKRFGADTFFVEKGSPAPGTANAAGAKKSSR